jgi:hypothetical protein
MIKILYSILILCIVFQLIYARVRRDSQKDNNRRDIQRNVVEEESPVIEKKFQRNSNIGI